MHFLLSYVPYVFILDLFKTGYYETVDPAGDISIFNKRFQYNIKFTNEQLLDKIKTYGGMCATHLYINDNTATYADMDLAPTITVIFILFMLSIFCVIEDMEVNLCHQLLTYFVQVEYSTQTKNVKNNTTYPFLVIFYLKSIIFHLKIIIILFLLGLRRFGLVPIVLAATLPIIERDTEPLGIMLDGTFCLTNEFYVFCSPINK